MLSDIDIWRSANLLIKRYGSDASLEAAQHADILLANGAMDGCRVWKRILKAIEELERTEKRETEPLN